MVERKDFAKAFLFWLFFGGVGAHRFYIRENALVFLWYFPATVCTLGILPLVDIFLLKGMINSKYEDDRIKEQALSRLQENMRETDEFLKEYK
jgi:hypothetical protein